MKRRKLLQSPIAPLFFLILIASGYLFGERTQRAEETASQNQPSVQEQQAEKESESPDPSGEETEVSPTPEPSKTEAPEDTRTDAKKAMDAGTGLGEKAADEYAANIIELYCDRKASECSSSNLIRSNENQTFRQSFDEMNGYMGLVRLCASKETESIFTVTTKIENVTAVLVFPDQTYVTLDCNQQITCPIPAGNSILLYIGEHLKGKIQVEVEPNQFITCKRM